MAFARTVTHTKTLISPSTGSADLVYGADYVSATSHTAAVSGATSGGIPYFDSATSEACSALLASGGVVIGGGAGNPPATLASLGTSGWVLTSQGAGQPPIFAAAPAGALNAITAATGAVTIASGNNTGIVWNWANTTNSTIAHTFGETTAATNGTSTSGVPNQVLLKINTLANSTQSPLSVFSRDTHAFSVDPSNPAILANIASNSNPSYSFANDSDTGVFHPATNTVGIAAGGTDVAHIFNSANGGFLSVSVNGSHPNIVPNTAIAANNNSSTSSGLRLNYVNTADSSVGTISILRSRGTIASPTVITTGDTLSSLSSYAYLGATNTYRETGRWECTSKGTISDATTGVGSIWTLYGKTQGTDVTVQPALVVTDGSTATIKFAGTGMSTANATTACAITAVGPAGANTTVQEWLTVTMPSGNVRYIPCF